MVEIEIQKTEEQKDIFDYGFDRSLNKNMNRDINPTVYDTNVGSVNPYAQNIVTGQAIQSGNYQTGSKGWQVKADGSAEFQSLTVSGVVVTGKGTFGGDGSDGQLSISSGTTTIALGSAEVVTKNYTSISITGTGALAFSGAATNGTVVILKSQKGVTLTSTTNPLIDLRSVGATGGAAVSSVSDGNPGSDSSLYIDTSDHFGAAGTAGGAAAGGVAASQQAFYTSRTNDLARKYIAVIPGSGGGSGRVNAAGGTSGAGGTGGGGLIIECAGALNVTGTINANGAVGANGTAADQTGGGGGGAGGMIVIVYNTLTANTGTYTKNGGAGGSSGNTTTANGGGGGGACVPAGGAGGTAAASAIAGTAGFGTNGGSAGAGGGLNGGGGGGGGESLVIQNIAFT